MKTSMTKIAAVAVISCAILSQACSTAKVRILPGENGINQVVSKDIERDGAEEAAANEAREYCEKRGKQMYVTKEDKTSYQGSMDEGTRKTVRNASKAAFMLGGFGSAVSSAGSAGHMMTSDRDYEARFSFTCK